jgi:hypothetical protein
VAASSLVGLLVLAASCGGAVSDERAVDEPAAVETIAGSELATITLTPRAAERLAIETQPVLEEAGRTVVPSAAVFVDPEGQFWVYTTTESDPLRFVRAPVRIAEQAGGRAVLTSGPATGTRVVTVGVAELYGAETGIDH